MHPVANRTQTHVFLFVFLLFSEVVLRPSDRWLWCCETHKKPLYKPYLLKKFKKNVGDACWLNFHYEVKACISADVRCDKIIIIITIMMTIIIIMGDFKVEIPTEKLYHFNAVQIWSFQSAFNPPHRRLTDSRHHQVVIRVIASRNWLATFYTSQWLFTQQAQMFRKHQICTFINNWKLTNCTSTILNCIVRHWLVEETCRDVVHIFKVS